MFGSIIKFFHEGGPTMYITATAGLFGIWISIDRFKKLYRDYSGNNELVLARVKELMLQNRLEDAIQYCNLNEKGLLAHVLRSGLERAGCDEALIRQSMESSYLGIVPKVTNKLSYLALIANAGMLFGLLGTVLGLIRQFGALASSEAANKQILMAQGIAEAMNNTALGLMVALPCLVAHGIFSARAGKLLEEVEHGASQFMDWMGLYNFGQLQSRLGKKNAAFTAANEKAAA